MDPSNITRRGAMQTGLVGLAGSLVTDDAVAVDAPPGQTPPANSTRPLLTSARDFRDVSRGSPVPHSLRGEALTRARLTAETWRLEIVVENNATLTNQKRLEDNTALTLADLTRLSERHAVRFLKAMQCNNIARPLGQGLWEGIPLRDVLALCGTIGNARRLHYWGFHNNEERQMFRSSMAINQVLDSPPGDLPPFLAYRLNGGPIPLERGGPVRMVVPWAHGFKSVKWLQRITLTSDYQANDTYALRNNDPESYLKTAAYFDNTNREQFPAGRPIGVGGSAMVGWPGLERVEYWLRPATDQPLDLPDDSPAWRTARWQPCVIEPAPTQWHNLPENVLPREVHGFGQNGQPTEWPIRFTFVLWSLTLNNVAAGRYEIRVRTVDRNGFAQPQPRPLQKSGRNRIQAKIIEVTA